VLSVPRPVQIKQVQVELGSVRVPALIQVPGTQREVLVTRLIALTVSRFVNAMSMQGASHSQPRPQPAASEAKRRRVTRQQSGACGSIPHATDAPANAQAGTQRAGAAPMHMAASGDAPAQQPSAGALHHVLDIVDGDAPAQLSVAEVGELIEAARFCMADAALPHLPRYLAPLLATAPYLEVRDIASMQCHVLLS
jgi:hypothetical protein